MPNIKVKYIIDENGDRVAPVTHIDAVRDSSGNGLSDLMVPEKLGSGIGTCSTSSGTALTVSLTGYELVQNGFVAVTFANDVPAGATLNINSKGAKPIYYKGAAIEADTIKADDTVMFAYDGTNYVVTSLGGGGGSSDWKATIIVNLEAYEKTVKISQDFAGVEVTLTDTTDSEVVDAITVASGDTSVTFSGLTPKKDYSISVSGIEGFGLPDSQSISDISIGATVVKTFNYYKITYLTGYIVLDQTSSDPTTKVLDMEGNGYSNYQRPEVITAIRNASHRYVGTFANNVMSLKQLSDTDGTKYTDNTSAATDIATQGKDVFVRLPFFFTKASEIETDKWKIEFAFDPDQTATTTEIPFGTGWKQWGGNDLIGVYEASVSDTGDNTTGGLYSRSGVASNGSITRDNFRMKAQNRGAGFTCIKLRHQNIMAILFYAYYGHTNCQLLCGSGSNSTTKNTGLKNSFGMTDTTSSNGNTDSINFWGLENWWGNKYEIVDNVVINAGSFVITEDDGSTRTPSGTGTPSGWVWPRKFILGDNLDTLSAVGQTGGSDSQGYCDGQYKDSYTNRLFLRSHEGNGSYGGLTYINGSVPITDRGTSYTSRLIYKGAIEIV